MSLNGSAIRHEPRPGRHTTGAPRVPRLAFGWALPWLVFLWILQAFPSWSDDAAAASQPAAVDEASTTRLTLAVLDFENQSGDPALAHWRYAPFVHLHDAKAIRLAPGVDYALRQLNRKRGDPVDAAVARQVGEWIEARRVVWGNYRRQDQKWVVSAYVLNVATGKTSGELTATATDWFEMRDQLGQRLLQELGITVTEAERRKMAERPTASVEAVEWLAKALAFEAEHKPLPETEHAMRQALKADPKCAEAHHALASLAYSRGKKAESETAVRQALELKPDMAQGHLILGVLLSTQEKFYEAEDEMRAAARLDPDEEEIFDRLGELYRAQGWLSRAIINFDKARALNPFAADIHANLGLALARNGQREKALAALQEAGRLASPDDVNAEMMMAQAYSVLRELPAAIEHTERFITQARRIEVNPPLVDDFAAELGKLKSRLAVSFVTASRPKSYSPQSLRETLRQKLSSEELTLVKDPLASTPEMDRWARELTQGATNDTQRGRRLFEALVRHLDPGPGGSRRAEEVFAAWNEPQVAFRCQEYARLFVALARAVGLPAFFTMVERDHEDQPVTHACAALFVDGQVLLVDPSYFWFGVPHKQFGIQDDLQSVAGHLNQNRDLRRRTIAVKLDPDSFHARMNLVFGLMNAEQWKEVRRELPGALAMEPDGFWARVAKARLAEHDGKLAAAARLLEEAVPLMPRSALVHALLGETYYRQDRLREARQELRLALRLPQEEDIVECARCRIAMINERIGNDQ